MNSSSSQSFVRRQYVNILFNNFPCSESAINQNASINKNSKSTNSKSLKQHTFAKLLSFCCFCFCLAREIDRFLILIIKCLLHSIEIKIFNKILILVVFAYIYFRSFDFARLLLSHLFLHVYRICLEIFSFNNDLSRYLRFNQ